ncbi:MAG: hypothetical protein Q9213_008050 [Squamulea squamosa]
MVDTNVALEKHINEEHIDPQLIFRCPLESCAELVPKINLPNHQAQQHQLDNYFCTLNDCVGTYPTSNELRDHILSNHRQLDCRFGGCEVSLEDPMQLKHHVVEDHLDLSDFTWPDDVVFDEQYNANRDDNRLGLPGAMANAACDPAYTPNGRHHPMQYYDSSLSYPPAYNTATGYDPPNTAVPSLPTNYHHRTFADQVQMAWHESQPSHSAPKKPVTDGQAADQVNSNSCSLAFTIPASGKGPQTSGHTCQWMAYPDTNVLCNQAFDSPKALQEHLRRDHCTTCNATKSSPKAPAICRWHGCSRKGEPLTDVHKLIRHALTHSDYRDYACSYCGKECTTKGQLVIHERVHTGEKPIKCEFCSKTTSNESQMGKSDRPI